VGTLFNVPAACDKSSAPWRRGLRNSQRGESKIAPHGRAFILEITTLEEIIMSKKINWLARRDTLRARYAKLADLQLALMQAIYNEEHAPDSATDAQITRLNEKYLDAEKAVAEFEQVTDEKIAGWMDQAHNLK
jgi:hypothetical protein